MQIACAKYSVFPTLTGLSTLSGRRAIPTCQCRRLDSVNYFFYVFLNFFSVFDKFGTIFVGGILREREREREREHVDYSVLHIIMCKPRRVLSCRGFCVCSGTNQ